jgi:hypothetical protein
MRGWRACSSRTCDRVFEAAQIGATGAGACRNSAALDAAALARAVSRHGSAHTARRVGLRCGFRRRDPNPETALGAAAMPVSIPPRRRRLGVEKKNAGPVNPRWRWTLGRFGYKFGPWTTKQGRGCIVNFRIILLAATTMLLGDIALAQLAVTPATSTATPVLSGTYIVRVTHVCQVLIDITQTTPNPVAGVTVDNSGDANQNIGTITFNHSTGKATMSADSLDGSPVLFSYNGATPLGNVLTDTPPPIPPPSYAYSNTGTSFTVGLESGGSVTYHAFYANINGSTKIPQFVIFGGIEKAGCTTTGIAIHQ